MGLRRGFKAEAERISAEVRTELELWPLDQLDPFHLADYLGVQVFGLRELARFDGGGANFVQSGLRSLLSLSSAGIAA